MVDAHAEVTKMHDSVQPTATVTAQPTSRATVWPRLNATAQSTVEVHKPTGPHRPRPTAHKPRPTAHKPNLRPTVHEPRLMVHGPRPTEQLTMHEPAPRPTAQPAVHKPKSMRRLTTCSSKSPTPGHMRGQTAMTEPRLKVHESRPTAHEPRAMAHEPKPMVHGPRAMAHEPRARAMAHKSRAMAQPSPRPTAMVSAVAAATPSGAHLCALPAIGCY